MATLPLTRPRFIGTVNSDGLLYRIDKYRPHESSPEYLDAYRLRTMYHRYAQQLSPAAFSTNRSSAVLHPTCGYMQSKKDAIGMQGQATHGHNGLRRLATRLEAVELYLNWVETQESTVVSAIIAFL